MEKPNFYSYFEIRSKGYPDCCAGYITTGRDFCPDSITKKLGITPHETAVMGESRKSGIGKWPLSLWRAAFQVTPEDATQCKGIINELKDKIPLLQEIYAELDVEFSIQLVAYVKDGFVPLFGFDKEVIEFCYLTNTEIGLDILVSSTED